MPQKMEHALKELAEPINIHINDPIAKIIVGLLKDTLVIWGGEFGRTPFLQGKQYWRKRRRYLGYH